MVWYAPWKAITTPNVKNPSGLPPQSAPEPAGGVRSAVKGIFRKEGDFWTVGYGEKVFRFKDSTGLAYIGYLLRYPGTEFHVLDLGTHRTSGPEASDDKAQLSPAESAQELEASGIHVGNLGDAGKALDDQAKAGYKSRPHLPADLVPPVRFKSSVPSASSLENWAFRDTGLHVTVPSFHASDCESPERRRDFAEGR